MVVISSTHSVLYEWCYICYISREQQQLEILFLYPKYLKVVGCNPEPQHFKVTFANITRSLAANIKDFILKAYQNFSKMLMDNNFAVFTYLLEICGEHFYETLKCYIQHYFQLEVKKNSIFQGKNSLIRGPHNHTSDFFRYVSL